MRLNQVSPCHCVPDLELVEAAFVGQAGVMVRAMAVPPARGARAAGPKAKKHKKTNNWLENEVPLPEFPPPSLEAIRAHFATPNGTVVVAQTASTATLPCVVKKPNLGAVSTWYLLGIEKQKQGCRREHL